MSVVLKFISLTACLAVAACSVRPVQVGQSADIVLLNGRFHTVDDANPNAEAVAIADGRFVYVGSTEGASHYIGEDTIDADLGGQFVIPGIIDGHTHPARRGTAKYDAYIGVGGHEETLKQLREVALENPGKDWLRICCFTYRNYVGEGKLGPDKAELDKIFPDRPVMVLSLTAHSLWVNSAALGIMGIDGGTSDPAPNVAYYGRDENGEPSGWLVEGAGWQHLSGLFPAHPEAIEDALDTALSKLQSFGVTTVYDGGNFGYEDGVYAYLAELDRAGKLPVRYEGTFAVPVPERLGDAITETLRLQEQYGGNRLNFGTVKLFMDGITPELAGGMIEPYVGYPDRQQSTTLSVGELRDWLLELHAARLDLHVHTIGNLSVRRVLDAVEAAQAIIGDGFYPRVSVAHLETIHIEDWPRFAELGVSANFTPHWHGRPLSNMSTDLLGMERAMHIYPANALINAGANVTFGSDSFDPDDFNPMLSFQVGHNRRYPEEWGPEAGFRPPASEKISLDNLVRGYTLNGAYPLRFEEDLGSIEVGKIADLVVLDASPFEVDRFEINRISPTLVIMEGEITLGEVNP